MAVNRYDTPAQMQYQNTYVPIPFEQLFTLGKEAKQDVEDALDEYNAVLDKFDEFQSPSDVDTQAYYDETYGRFTPFAEKMATNLDQLKTPEGRAELYHLINTTDRAKLSMLRQSAEAMKERQQFNQQLILNGKYNPRWHDVDFGNYNTQSSGIFNDVQPLEFRSIKDITDKYVNDIKDSYLGKTGLLMWSGVTEDKLRDTLNAQKTSIFSDPVARKHVEYMADDLQSVDPKLTREEAITKAQDEFIEQAVNDNNEYVHKTVEVDPTWRLALKSGRSGLGASNNVDLTPYERQTASFVQYQTDKDTSDQRQNMYNSILNSSDDNNIKKYRDLLSSGKTNFTEDELKTITSAMQAVKREANRQELNNSFGNYGITFNLDDSDSNSFQSLVEKLNNKELNNSNRKKLIHDNKNNLVRIKNGAENWFDSNAVSGNNGYLNQWEAQAMSGKTKYELNVNGVASTLYRLDNSKDRQTVLKFVCNQNDYDSYKYTFTSADASGKVTTDSKITNKNLDEDINNGTIKNVYVGGLEDATFSIIKNQKATNYVTQTMYIPEQSLINAGYAKKTLQEEWTDQFGNNSVIKGSNFQLRENSPTGNNPNQYSKQNENYYVLRTVVKLQPNSNNRLGADTQTTKAAGGTKTQSAVYPAYAAIASGADFSDAQDLGYNIGGGGNDYMTFEDYQDLYGY